MSDLEQRLREAEALSLLTNRIMLDYLSLQFDSGQASLEGVQKLVSFSADEVIKGSAAHEEQVRFFERVINERFSSTFGDRA